MACVYQWFLALGRSTVMKAWVDNRRWAKDPARRTRTGHVLGGGARRHVRGPDRHSVESLVCALEDVREGVGRMDQALHSSKESRPWRRLAL
jgi:hypothetical protein